jgi:Leucine-rich repeat (LRR) protein
METPSTHYNPYKHGPDTEYLLWKLQNYKINSNIYPLVLSNLKITSIPYIPNGVEQLFCCNTLLTELPYLPTSLKLLACNNSPITKLPILPPKLEHLSCSDTKITVLPRLPQTLKELSFSGTAVRRIPNFPPDIFYIYCTYCPLIIKKQNNETLKDFINRWLKWIDEEDMFESMIRTYDRTDVLKDSLLAEVYSPRRIERFRQLAGAEMGDLHKIF